MCEDFVFKTLPSVCVSSFSYVLDLQKKTKLVCYRLFTDNGLSKYIPNCYRVYVIRIVMRKKYILNRNVVVDVKRK